MVRDIVPYLKILVLFVCFFLLGACSRSTDQAGQPKLSEHEAVKQAVIAYDEALRISLRNFKTNKLGQLTTARKYNVDKDYVLKNKRAQVKIVAQLTQINFRKVQVEGDRGIVEVIEVWYVEKTDISSGKIFVAGEDYNKIIYGLVKDHGRWLVDSTDVTLYKIETR